MVSEYGSRYFHYNIENIDGKLIINPRKEHSLEINKEIALIRVHSESNYDVRECFFYNNQSLDIKFLPESPQKTIKDFELVNVKHFDSIESFNFVTNPGDKFSISLFMSEKAPYNYQLRPSFGF